MTDPTPTQEVLTRMQDHLRALGKRASYRALTEMFRADRVVLSESSVASWAQGKREPTPSTLEAILRSWDAQNMPLLWGPLGNSRWQQSPATQARRLLSELEHSARAAETRNTKVVVEEILHLRTCLEAILDNSRQLGDGPADW